MKKLIINAVLILLISSCASDRLMSYSLKSKNGTVNIRTNIPDKVIYENLNSEKIEIKSSERLVFNYDFKKNSFKKENLTLKLVPNAKYQTNDSIIVINRKMRLVSLCYLFFAPWDIPILVVDFANGNIWKINKNDKNINLYFEPKIDFYDRTLDRLVLKKDLDSIDILVSKYPNEPYIGKSKAARNKCFPYILDRLVLKKDLDSIDILVSKYPNEPLIGKSKAARNKCIGKINKYLDSLVTEIDNYCFIASKSNDYAKINSIEKKLVKCVDNYFNFKFSEKINLTEKTKNSSFIVLYINSKYKSILKVSEPCEFKIRYDELQLISNSNKEFLSSESKKKIQELDNKIKSFFGYSQLNFEYSGLNFPKYDHLKQGLYIQVYNKDQPTKASVAFPNNLNVGDIVIIQYDFPDSEVTENESINYTEKKIKSQFTRENIYYRYFQVDNIVNNEDRSRNLAIQRKKDERATEINNAIFNNTPIGANIKAVENASKQTMLLNQMEAKLGPTGPTWRKMATFKEIYKELGAQKHKINPLFHRHARKSLDLEVFPLYMHNNLWQFTAQWGVNYQKEFLLKSGGSENINFGEISPNILYEKCK